jgi:hypothetical protein
MIPEWRQLEVLVSQLERMLAPEGVKVQSPERFYYEDGTQKAEVDVTLRSNIGSVTIFIGLECRFRPSDGPQGSDWIRDVASKKKLVGADRFIAVSSTGFTASALHAAEELGVDLRQMESVEEISNQGWFRTMIFAHAQPFWEQNGNTEAYISTQTLRRKFDIENAIVGVDKSYLPLKELVNRRVDKIHGLPYRFPANIRIPTVLDLIEVHTLIVDGNEYRVDALKLPIVTWREMQHERMLLNYYKNPKKPSEFSIVGSCEMKTSDIAFRITVVGTENPLKPNSRKLKWQFFTLDNQPHTGIDGTLQFVDIKHLY